MPHARKNTIFLEPGPSHRKIIQLDERADVKAGAARLDIDAFEVVDDLTLAGRRAGDQEENVESIA
jgi:hypothetical protein